MSDRGHVASDWRRANAAVTRGTVAANIPLGGRGARACGEAPGERPQAPHVSRALGAPDAAEGLAPDPLTDHRYDAYIAI